MLPQHVAFIMDGNRRWARSRRLPVIFGHRKGYNRIEEIVEHADKRGVTYVTFWAFSTENWNREKKEVDDLLGLFRRLFTTRALEKTIRNNAKINVFGDMSAFPQDIQQNILDVLEKTKNATGIVVNIALNYGGRQEILKAVNKLVQEGVEGIDELEFANHLYSAGQPDPDLLIRTGGEKRLSGYLPWQTVYTELLFLDTFWPDFDKKELDKALEEYEHRSRRFGQ